MELKNEKYSMVCYVQLTISCILYNSIIVVDA